MSVRRAAPAGGYSMVAAVALAVGAAALAGCGSSSSSSSSATTSATPANTTTSTPASSTPVPGTTTSGAQKLSIAANPEGQLKYTTSSLTAKAGAATVAFTNSAPLEHNLTIASSSGSVVGATPTFQGGAKTITVKLAAGTYKFYCTVPGHRAAGMEGTLTVK
jgi:plastocyanin